VFDAATLAQRFAASPTPVREAIRQLEAIGYVGASPHRGAVVPLFTPERLSEMVMVRAGTMAETRHAARVAARRSRPRGGSTARSPNMRRSSRRSGRARCRGRRAAGARP